VVGLFLFVFGVLWGGSQMTGIIRSAGLCLVAVAAIVGGAAVAPTPVQAQGIYLGVGPGWHGDDWRWRHHRRYWRDYGSADCRVVVRRYWRHGERVVVRRRECF
jgi:hypothetical protein